MICKFRITSPESKNFQLAVEADGKNTFLEFHTIIQQGVDFESHQLASFFLSDINGRKQQEVSLLDLGLNGGIYHTMQKTKLSDLIQSEAQKITYTFDLINDRSLFIELTGIVMEKNLKEPLITLKQGEAPVQILGDDSPAQDSAKLQEEEVLMDFGILDDYTELYGEMEDY
ncbi:pRiA4b ORF-3-like protein [Mariniphaga anaerophila]|uniref:PRiA4b ORF-3-like protein n=1 Tax=Mariniphaga anaerophila TaxID=1484053 RepID=A0A1M5FZM3_9BACT|nr:hypothetical protein [Mariniphaga anaerophila]SHF96651.1 pRiA4b ORF-3-like protein [Mariniphaga anaerophila]